MLTKPFVMDVAKLLIALAWADGEVQPEEVNAIKRLFFDVDNVTGADWKELELYLDHPLSEAERETLLQQVVSGVRSRKERKFVVESLRKLVEADGVVTEEERQMLERFEQAVEAQASGAFAAIRKIFSGGGGRASVREDRVDDLVRNPVYYRLDTLMKDGRVQIDLDEPMLRKLCVAAGLMAKIACLAGDVSDDERDVMVATVANDWPVDPSSAAHIVDLAIERGLEGLDTFRLGESFQEVAPHDERVYLLSTLFQIAHASDGRSSDEMSEIRKIGKCLRLSPREINDVMRSGGFVTYNRS